MRSLSPTLLTAQKSASAVPYLQVKASERIGGIARLNWQRLYTGSEPDGYHALTLPSDGSLLRARVSGGTLWVQRVTNPAPGADFSPWGNFGGVANAGIALASSGANVLLFFVGTDGLTVYLRESTDSGATWGAPSTLVTASGAVGWLAAALKPAGPVLLLYSVGVTVFSLKRSGGVWGTPTPWSNSLSSLKGLACTYRGDWNVAVAGGSADGSKALWTCLYGDGFSQSLDTWSPLQELMMASPGSALSYQAPFLAAADVFRLSFLEQYGGIGSYSRPHLTHSLATASFVDNLWREPVPFDLAADFGLAVAHQGNYAWLSLPFGVWRASLVPAELDLSSDLLSLSLSLNSEGEEALLEVRNDGGRYLGAGSGTLSPLSKGAEVSVSPGYRTSAGGEISLGPRFWIEEYAFLSRGGVELLALRLQGPWHLLEGWRGRRQFSWAQGSKNVFQLLAFVLARAGLEFAALSNSPDAVNLYPAFTIQPGESGARAVRRLLVLIPDVILFRDQFAYLKNPLATEGPAYSYGTDHRLYEARRSTLAPAVNRIQVYGDGAFSEGLAWQEVALVHDRLAQVRDRNLTTLSQAQSRAQAELRALALDTSSGEILVPVNSGQELWDVVEITEPRVGWAAARHRVTGLELSYRAAGHRRSQYQMRLRLGGL